MKSPANRPGALLRPAFSFIDLFAGIGGMRLAFEQHGGRCIFTSEWDKFARQTYIRNFDCTDHALAGDITKIPADAIPPHDLLLAGFPCQPFSLIGIGSKNTRHVKHGFADKTQGTLFFDIARIIAHHKPKAFLLENVKNLMSHDKGRTLKTILDILETDLGYHVQWRILNAKGIVPQNRNRIYIIGFREKTDFDFKSFALRYPSRPPILGDIMQNPDEIDSGFTLSDKAVASANHHDERNRKNGNGFRTKYVGPGDIIPALVACYATNRSFFIKQSHKNPRKMTPRECARAMGFPDEFDIPVSNTQAWKQFGNSVAVPVISQIAEAMTVFLVENQEINTYTRYHENYNKNMLCNTGGFNNTDLHHQRDCTDMGLHQPL